MCNSVLVKWLYTTLPQTSSEYKSIDTHHSHMYSFGQEPMTTRDTNHHCTLYM